MRVTSDGLLYAVDLVMVVTGLARDQSGLVLRRLSDEIFPSIKLIERKLPGKGNAHTKLVSFQDAIELVMVLPGKVAKETRTKFADIIRRYLAGDRSLIAEIQANAQSDAPIAQLARAADPSKADSKEIPTEEELAERKRRLEREDLEMRALDADIQHKKLCNVKLFADTMKMLNPFWSDDARLRLQTEDWLKNIAFNSQPLAIANGNSAATDADRSISVSQVAQEMGKRLTHGQLVQVGSAVARRYREKYGSEPSKHSQWVDGAERKVNSYTEKDRGLMVEALQEVLNI